MSLTVEELNQLGPPWNISPEIPQSIDTTNSIASFIAFDQLHHRPSRSLRLYGIRNDGLWLTDGASYNYRLYAEDGEYYDPEYTIYTIEQILGLEPASPVESSHSHWRPA